MANIEGNPYEQAVAQFNSLEDQAVAADTYIASIANVQAQGFAAGIPDSELYTVLERMTGTGLSRVAGEPNTPSIDTLTSMQNGYKAALERINQAASAASSKETPSTPTPPSRSRRGIAAG